MSSGIKFSNEELKLNQRGFKISWNTLSKTKISAFGRRHFFLILLSIGESKVHFSNYTFHLKGSYLFFANPSLPYATEIISENHKGYACLFTEKFIAPIKRLESIQKSPLYNLQTSPAIKLNKEQEKKFLSIFNEIAVKDTTDYLYKDDLMRNYINLIIHEALQLKPDEHFNNLSNAALRITIRFVELLESQFPIDDLNDAIKFKSPKQYANHLAIHVNYLNRSVKEITGKATSQIIAQRLTTEAKDLLRQTTWSVAEIAYSLGFDQPSYFSKFFKKITGKTPKHYRKNQV